MYHPQTSLFERGQELTLSAVLYPRPDGYVDLILTVHPRLTVDVVERATYAGLTLEEASDVWLSQASLLVPQAGD